MLFKPLAIYQFASVRSAGDGRTTVNGDKMKIDEDDYDIMFQLMMDRARCSAQIL